MSSKQLPNVRRFKNKNETMQCSLVLIAQARNTINRKRFLGEHERTVSSKFEVRGSKLCSVC
ncbi:MAG: hypothetical protein FWC60_03165 [Firmicutes bacterium]|nr:hypothetical protein [Bacillota bacterium]